MTIKTWERTRWVNHPGASIVSPYWRPDGTIEGYIIHLANGQKITRRLNHCRQINTGREDFISGNHAARTEGREMKWYLIVKKIEGLPRYKVGKRIPLYQGNKGQLLYHVWTTIVEVPEDCVKDVPWEL